MFFSHWFRFVRVFVSRKRHFQCQIIYVTNQDRKGVVYVIVISTLINILVRVVPQGLEPNREAKEYGNNDELLWTVFLEATPTGT